MHGFAKVVKAWYVFAPLEAILQFYLTSYLGKSLKTKLQRPMVEVTVEPPLSTSVENNRL